MQANEIAVLPKHIEQLDNTHFQITWTDGMVFKYRLSDVQNLCPCAHCRDEGSGKRRASAAKVNSDVRARYVKGVGGYALQIAFSEGCSNGIYSFAYLYRIGEQELWKDGKCVS